MNRSGRLIGTLIGLGCLLRLIEYGFGRNYWFDESSLARNLTSKSLLELFGPLDNTQLAPAGFLALEKGLSRLLGDSPYVLRFVPLCAGIGSLALFPTLARRFAGPIAVLLALALLVLSRDLIYYSGELKPYSSDVFLGLVGLLLTIRLLETDLTWRRTFGAGIAGALLFWFSFPGVFVLGSGWLNLAWSVGRRRGVEGGVSQRSWTRLLALGAAWAVSALALKVVAHRQLGHRRDMWAFWDSVFPRWPPRTLFDLSWPLRRFLFLFYNPLDFSTPFDARISILFPLALFLIGLVALARRNGSRLLVLLGPGLLAFVAGALRVYPFHGRLILFLVPSLLLVIAAGAESIRGSRVPRFVWGLTLALLLLFPTLTALGFITSPIAYRELHPYGDLRSNKVDPGRFPF